MTAPRKIFVRSMLTLALPVILFWAFVEELCRGLRRALRFACLEVRINLAAYHHEMHREDY